MPSTCTTGRSPLDVAADLDIMEDCPSLDADAAYALADAIEAAMDARPGEAWTPSGLGRVVHAETYKVRQVLGWLVRRHFIRTDERGAWSRYYR